MRPLHLLTRARWHFTRPPFKPAFVFPFTPPLGEYYIITTSAPPSLSPIRGEVSSVRWCCGNFISSPFPLMNLETCLAYSITTKIDSKWLYFKARLRKTLLRGYPSNVKGGRRNSSSSWGTTGSSPEDYPRILVF